MIGIYVTAFAFMLLSWYVSMKLKNKIAEYSQVAFRGNMTGAEVAAKMLRDNNITDVKIISVEGQLTDHYNPVEKTVNLSPDVYHGRSVAAAAIAAHECGHAVQHQQAYMWLGLRSQLVPAVQASSTVMPWVLMGGVLMVGIFPWLLFAGIIMFALTTLFSFITLPVEFDASNRALAWIESSGVASSQEHGMAKDALKWAAMTYVVSALYSLAVLLQYVMIFLRRR
ncbi:MAG: zinc metallopeptidase [Chitinophagales bacterium]